MNLVRVSILGLALLAAGLAAFVARNLVAKPDAAPVIQEIVKAPTNDVLVAASDIAVGKRVGKSDLRWQEWPETAVNSRYITRKDDPNAAEAFAGTIARFALYKGEPVSAQKLIDYAKSGFMSALLAPGMRAISTKISPETGAGGFILPNDRVDILLTRQAGERGQRNSYSSSTLLLNIRVLAIDQSVSEADDKTVAIGKTATLEMSLPDAETFLRAVKEGTVTLALRSMADAEIDPNLIPLSSDRSRSNGRTNSVRVIKYGTESRAGSVGGADYE